MIGGKLTFRNLSGSDFDGRLQWRKGRDPRSPQQEDSYSQGFDLAVGAIGDTFVPAAADERLLPTLADQHHNAEATFIGPTAPLESGGVSDKIVSWLKTNSIVHYGPLRLSATANRFDGSLTGSVL